MTTWKMYALKGDEKLDQVWEICIARSAEEAAKVFDRYFYHGTPWPPPPMDPSEIEPPEKSLNFSFGRRELGRRQNPHNFSASHVSQNGGIKHVQ